MKLISTTPNQAGIDRRVYEHGGRTVSVIYFCGSFEARVGDDEPVTIRDSGVLTFEQAAQVATTGR